MGSWHIVRALSLSLCFAKLQYVVLFKIQEKQRTLYFHLQSDVLSLPYVTKIGQTGTLIG